jgi:hypothetical protein
MALYVTAAQALCTVSYSNSRALRRPAQACGMLATGRLSQKRTEKPMNRLLAVICAGLVATAALAQTNAPPAATTDKPGGASSITPTPGPATSPALPAATTPDVVKENKAQAKADKEAKKKKSSKKPRKNKNSSSTSSGSAAK